MKGGNFLRILNRYTDEHCGSLVTTREVQEWILLNYGKKTSAYRLGQVLSRHPLFIVESRKPGGQCYRVRSRMKAWLEGLTGVQL